MNALQPPEEGGRRGPSFSLKIYGPAGERAPIAASLSRARSRPRREGGGRTAIYLCKFTAEKIQPERKVSDGWAPHFWSPSLLHVFEDVQGRAKLMELSLVTHVPSGPIGCAWAGHFAWQK